MLASTSTQRVKHHSALCCPHLLEQLVPGDEVSTVMPGVAHWFTDVEHPPTTNRRD